MARRRGRRQLRVLPVPDHVLLDSEGLNRAITNNLRVRVELAMAERFGSEIHVSAVTLAETLRGARDARIHAFLQGVRQEAVTPLLGRAASELLGQTHRAETLDAIVAVTARALGGRVRILTSDPEDLRALTAEMEEVSVVRV